VTIILTRDLWPYLSKPIQTYLDQSLIFLGWFALVGVIGTYIIMRMTFRPINKAIDKNFEMVEKSNYKARLEIDPKFGKEIGKVMRQLNSVLDRMSEVVKDNQNSMQDISHEINTQLTAIKQSVDVIKRYGIGDRGLINTKLNSIEQSVERTKQIMVALLALTKLKQGTYEANREDYFAEDLLEDFIAHHRRVFPTHVFDIQYDFSTSQINIDRDHFHLALNPIIENAVKYSYKDSKDVIIKVSEEDGVASVSITNQGAKIPDKDIPRLFERYYRGGNYTHKQGTGLGLHIVGEVLDLYEDVSIEVISKQGLTTFTLKFPAV